MAFPTGWVLKCDLLTQYSSVLHDYYRTEYLIAVDGSSTERITLGPGLQHVSVILGIGGDDASSAAGAEVLRVRLDAEVLHLSTGVLHAE